MSYLTAEDQAWVQLHTRLASMNDFEQFSELVIQDPKPATKSIKPPKAFNQRREANFLHKYCRPAQYADFSAWAKGYGAKGGEFRITREWSSFQDSFYVLEKMPETIPGLHGANSFDLIIPKSIAIRPEQIEQNFHGFCGHSNLFFMKKFIYFSVTKAPVYYKE